MALTLLAGCAPFCSLEPEANPNAPEPEPEPACTNDDGIDADRCQRNVDCITGWSCEKPEGASFADFGCCHQIYCTGEDDCGAGTRCDLNARLCIPIQPCDDVGPDDTCPRTDTCHWTSEGSMCAPPNPLARCEIIPPRLHVRDGDPLGYKIALLDERRDPVPPRAFTRRKGEHLIENGDLLIADCTDETCTETILFGFEGADLESEVSCTAELTVLGPRLERVIQFFDDETGEALTGDVLIVSEIGKTLFPDTEGEVTLPNSLDVNAVTVMVPGYHWRTLVGPPDEDLLIPLHASHHNGSTVSGAMAFDDLYGFGDFKVGVNGVSLHRPLYQMDLLQLFGREEQRIVSVDGLVINGLRSFPSATTVRIGTASFKEGFLAFGEPGRHLTWSLGAATLLSSLDDDFFGIDETTKMTQSLMALLRTSLGSHSAIGGPVTLLDHEPPGDTSAITNYAEWDAVDVAGDPSLQPGIFPQWSVGVTLPAGAPAADVNHLVVVVGLQTPLYGFVPLGLMRMAPAPETGLFVTDSQPDTPGRATMGFAPPHSGLEQSPLSALVMSFAEIETGGTAPKHNLILRDVSVGEDIVLDESWFEPANVGYDVGSDTLSADALIAGSRADITRVLVDVGDIQWEVLFNGAPIDGSGLRALLPDGTDTVLLLTDIQSLSLRPDVNTFPHLGSRVLLELDRHVDATYSHLH